MDMQHLSIAIIAHTGNRSIIVDQLLPTLPKGAEVVIVWNAEGEPSDLRTLSTTTDEHGGVLINAEYRWQDFSFADARNHSLHLCTREWILWIDSDDILNPFEHSTLANLTNIPAGVGGLMCTVAGLQPALYVGDDAKRYAVPQPRLIRNYLGFRFEGRCHEQVAWSIIHNGYTIQESVLTITHTGYVADIQTMIGKVRRNTHLLIHQCHEWDSEDHFFAKLLHRDLGNYLNLLEHQ